ncbi:hypothetical protein CNR22_02435 [Sphingobacteriaceae bacterium]|nr:hypothetical protein CNR22_02435 [Sphingobacteriaceae bacterium]
MKTTYSYFMSLRLALVFTLISISFHIYAQTGKNGTLTVSSGSLIVNKYSPVLVNIPSGSSTISALTGTFFPLCTGDLIMVYQAQGASGGTVNSAAYGAINQINSAGFYEFKYVQSVNGNTITTQSAFTNSYSSSGNTQVIKVPQYTTLTINSGASIIPKPWRDTTISSTNYRFGGLTVIHSSSIVNNGTISASGFGFRGGQITGAVTSYTLGITSYVEPAQGGGGEKGESVLGFQADYDLTGGRYGRGAPGNGGGGGNATNSAGGGGGNGYNGQSWNGQGVMVVDAANPLSAWALDPAYIANSNALTNSSGGGRGGYGWGVYNMNALVSGPNNSSWGGDFRSEVGGLGGRPLTNIAPETRIFFGGGGGAGQTNNYATPAASPGGGIVYLIATSAITGTGTIESNGQAASNSIGCNCDGQSGAGAGGTIIIKSFSLASTQSLIANGGKGGDQLTPTGSNSDESEGGGGGGGGGYIATSVAVANATVSGGNNGTTVSTAVTEFPSNGTTKGATGQTGTLTTTFITFNPQAGALGTFCLGSVINFTSIPASTYTWSGPNSFTSSIQNPTVLTTLATQGIYTVSLSFTNGCNGIQSLTTNISVNPSPTLSVNNMTICPGATATLTVSGASTYTWIPSNATGSFILVSPSASSFYTVTGSSAAGCSATASSTLTIPAIPSVSISANTLSTCVGNQISLTATMNGGIPPYTFSWTAGPSSSSYSVSQPAGTYDYTVSGFDSFGCIATNSLTLNFISNPVLIATSDTVCPGVTGTLSASGANSYTWYPSAFSGSLFTATPSALSVYTVVGTAVSGCTANTTGTLFMKPVPSLSFTTFAINCASLGSAMVSPVGGVGPFSYTWMPTAQTGTSATGLYPGTYSLDVLDAGLGCVTTQTTHFAALVPLTGTVVSTPSLLCFGAATGTATINLSNGSGSQSYQWSDALSTQTNTSPTNLTAGVNTVTVVDALTYCSVTHTFSIAQPAAFTLNISASSPSVCLGSSISFTALNSGGTAPYSYTWSPSFASSLLTVSELTAGNFTYNVSSSDNYNCTTNKSVTVKFVLNPTVSVSSPSVCSQTTATLTAIGATTYTWSGGFIGNPFTTVALSSTSYTVIGSVAGCTSSAISSVFIKPSPTPSFTSNSPICQGDTLILKSIDPGFLYYWTGPMNYSSTAIGDTLYSVLPNHGGNYTLKVTAPNSCTAAITKSITVNPTPSLSVSGTTVCQGQALGLNANFLAGASYTWQGQGNTSYLQSPVFTPAIPNFSGIYTLTVKSAAGCIHSLTTSASVIATPVPTITVSPDVCAGSSFILNASGGNTYSWFGPNGFNSTLQNPSVTNAGPGVSGNYSVYAYIGSCYGSTSTSVTVHSLPLTLASVPSAVCEQSSLTFNAGPASSYTWTGPGGFNSNLPNPVIVNTALTASGTYTLAITDQYGCSSYTTIQTTVMEAPLVSAEDASICLGGAVTLSATGLGTYQWSGPANYSSNSNAPYIAAANAANAGIYTVTLTDTKLCSASTTLQLSVLNFPLPVPTISSPQKACLHMAFDLIGNGGSSYLWRGPQDVTASTKNLSFIIRDFTMAGIYTLTVTDDNKCTAASTIEVKVYPKPEAKLNLSANNLCVPFCASLTITTPENAGITTLFYHVAEIRFNEKHPVHCISEAGRYVASVNYVDTNLCTNTSSLILNAYPTPRADFEFQPVNPIAGVDEVIFYNTSRGDELDTWNWHSTVDSVIQTEKNIRRLFSEAGNYPIVLVVKNKWGCADTVIKPLLINDDFGLYVPNAFTPNADGLNDIFQAKGTGIKNFNLEIFSRWGESLYQTYEFTSGWDGTFKGKECKTDSYVWKITITNYSGNTKSFTGIITLLRNRIPSEE